MEYLWKENYPTLSFTENRTVNTTFTSVLMEIELDCLTVRKLICHYTLMISLKIKERRKQMI